VKVQEHRRGTKRTKPERASDASFYLKWENVLISQAAEAAADDCRRCCWLRSDALWGGIHQMFLQFFYDFSTIIPCAHLPSFPRKILVSRSKENPSPNLACTKLFYNFSTKSP
jgi:hypothetical protein